MLVDVLQSRISFILPNSVRLSMNYTLLTTERNGAKLEFESFNICKKKRKTENTQITEIHQKTPNLIGWHRAIKGSLGYDTSILHFSNLLIFRDEK